MTDKAIVYLGKFPNGTKIITEVVFPGEYRIGWEYGGIKYVPGTGSYYTFLEAIQRAWFAFSQDFPAEAK